LNIINQNKEECRGYVEIDINTKTYKVERTSKKYIKKLKEKKSWHNHINHAGHRIDIKTTAHGETYYQIKKKAFFNITALADYLVRI
jgi:uncharacterized radical SAM superfamily Fe-S cluster-containing enzyme